MRLAILGKLSCLNALTVILTIIIISLISWYNNSNYIFSRLNSRFPTLSVLKAQQVDQYLLYTTNSVQSIVTRVILQNATSKFLRGEVISSTLNETAIQDLRNGANTTLDMLSARIIALNPKSTTWETVVQYTPNTTEATHFAPQVYNLIPIPPVAGIINPFTLSGTKYVFILTTPMMNNGNDSYLQIIFDSTRIANLLLQVTNSAEANTEYILLGALADPTKFQVLLPTLYHPNYARQIYPISSDASMKALFASRKPTNNGTGTTTYSSGIIYDFTNFAGQQVTGGYCRLLSGSTLGWGLVVQAPQQQVIAPLHRLRNILLISAFSCLVIMLLILMPIVWYCTRPVRTLRSVTRAAHEAPIDIEGLSRSKHRRLLGCFPNHFLDDEVTDIKESFIGLAGSLNEQYRSLDEKVASRTKDLYAAQQESLAANTAKSSFLANISHEFRSPLQSVITLADINMLEDQNVTDEVKQTLATIKESGSHLLFLISDILDFSKIEAGHLQLEERVFALGTGLINQLRISFRQKAAIQRIEFAIVTEPPELYQYNVRGDKHRLYQVLQNLLSNAFKFTANGTVTFQILNVNSNTFQFIVEDTGCGIPSKVIDNLFQPFIQADQSYSRKFGGTGLGLSVSKQLAELMGGEIHVTSEEGVGSIFTFTVPLIIAGTSETPLLSEALPTTPKLLSYTERKERKGTKDSPQSQISRGSLAHSVRNVLVADDSKVNRQVITKMLQRCGIKEITVAEDGLEALHLAQQRTFDLIYMDLSMPVLSGIDATRKLREGGYEGLIVALTAHVGMVEHERALEAGCDSVQVKPIMLDDMRIFLQSIGK